MQVLLDLEINFLKKNSKNLFENCFKTLISNSLKPY